MENGGGEERGRHSEPKKSILALNRPGRTARICLPPPPLFSKDLLPPNSKLFVCAVSQGASGNRRRYCSKMGRCLRATHGSGRIPVFSRHLHSTEALFGFGSDEKRKKSLAFLLSSFDSVFPETRGKSKKLPLLFLLHLVNGQCCICVCV